MNISSTPVLVAALMITLAAPATATEHHPVHDTQPPAVGHGSHYAPPDLNTLGGAFTLTDHTGRTVTERDFLGRYALFYFGYSKCDMACPTALISVARAIDGLGASASRVVPVFVDFDNSRLDPVQPRGAFEYQRDAAATKAHAAAAHTHAVQPMNQKEFAEFVRGVHPRMVGLIGTRAQINDMTRKFKVRRQHQTATSLEQKELGYRIDHTTHMYLVGPDGKVVEVFSYGESAQRMTERMRQRLEAGQASL